MTQTPFTSPAPSVRPVSHRFVCLGSVMQFLPVNFTEPTMTRRNMTDDKAAIDAYSVRSWTGLTTATEIAPTGLSVISSNRVVIHDHEIPNIVLYSIVLLLAVVGNVLVIITLLPNKPKRTVASCFLLSLSMSDLLLAIICMPITLTGRILKQFVFGRIMCKVMPSFMGISVSVSTFTMLAISVERYYAICRPLKSRVWQTTSHAYRVIVGIWIISCLINIPYFILSDMHYIPLIDYNRCSLACRLVFPSTLARQAWYVFILVTLFCIPGLFMTVAYFLVCCKIWQEFKVKCVSMSDGAAQDDECESDGLFISTQRKQLSLRRKIRSVRNFVTRNESSVYETSNGTTSSSALLSCPVTIKIEEATPRSEPQYQKGPRGGRKKKLAARRQEASLCHADRLVAKKKVVRMLIVIVILFFVCWTPLFIVNVWKAFDPQTAMEKLDGIIEIIQLMSYVSTCVNPVVYCFMNQKFREGFLRAFLYCLPRSCRKNGPRVREAG